MSPNGKYDEGCGGGGKAMKMSGVWMGDVLLAVAEHREAGVGRDMGNVLGVRWLHCGTGPGKGRASTGRSLAVISCRLVEVKSGSSANQEGGR